MQRIKLNDEVIVLTGKSKGHRGKVLKVLRNEDRKIERVIVEGANVVKKHVKPDPNRNIQGGIIDREASLHVSNVALYNAATKKGERVGFKLLKDGKKERYFKSSGEPVDI